MKKGMVSIIIVNWNGYKWLKDCFGSLYKQNYKKFEVIFVDNASSDESVRWVKTHYPKTVVVINKKNLGFAGANNVGFRKARGEYVLFLNNDTRVTKTFLTELVNVLKKDASIGGVQSKILLMDHPDTHDSVGAYLTPTGILYHYGFGKKDKKKYNNQIDLYTAKGACMMFRKEILDMVSMNRNIFDPDYFAYFEESDMCHRVWLAGYRIVYAYKSVIYHKMGATSSGMDNAFIQYHSFKNRIRTYMKNYGLFWLLAFMPVHIFFCELYTLMAIVRGKFALAWAIQRAIGWNVFQFLQTMHMRKKIQLSLRSVSDSFLAPYIFRYPPLGYYISLLQGNVTSYKD